MSQRATEWRGLVRLLIAATAMAAASPVAAQSQPAAPANLSASRCPELPADPRLPDGSRANAASMRRGDQTYQNWVRNFQAALNCRNAEVEELRALETQRRAEYNAATQRLNNVTAGWVGEADEFNQRPQRERR